MKTQTSIEIDRPIDVVFSLTNGDVAKWSTIVVEETITRDVNNGGVGTEFTIVTMDRGNRMEFAGTVIAHDPPNTSAIRMIGQYFDIEAAYTFEDLRGGRTRVTQLSVVSGKGFFKLMLALSGWFMKKSSCDAQLKELEGLKSYIENYEPSPV